MFFAWVTGRLVVSSIEIRKLGRGSGLGGKTVDMLNLDCRQDIQ